MKKIVYSFMVLPAMLLATTVSAHLNEICDANGCTSQSTNGYFGMMGGYGHMAGGFWFGYITMVLVWAVLILAVAALLKYLKRK